jgi:hypothetical protein
LVLLILIFAYGFFFNSFGPADSEIVLRSEEEKVNKLINGKWVRNWK